MVKSIRCFTRGPEFCSQFPQFTIACKSIHVHSTTKTDPEVQKLESTSACIPTHTCTAHLHEQYACSYTCIHIHMHTCIRNHSTHAQNTHTCTAHIHIHTDTHVQYTHRITHMHTHSYMQSHTHTLVYTHSYICNTYSIHMHAYTTTYTYNHTHSYTTHIHTLMYAHSHIYNTHMHTFIDTHIHSNTHMHEHRQELCWMHGCRSKVKLCQLDILHTLWHSESSIKKNK